MSAHETILMDVLRQALWVAAVISAPVLAVALVVGLVIGLLQALTSVQEMTLTFVPKLVAMLIAFWASLGLMTRSLSSLFTDHILPLVSGGPAGGA
jgi:flagellar biosynthetic protein FliQ